MITHRHTTWSCISIAAGLILAAGCTDNRAADGSGAIGVVSTDDECRVDAAVAQSGNVIFDVRNDGDQVTEFYLLADDGLRIIGEVENIGPGLTRQLVVTAGPGAYFTACKPGMIGDGIRAAFTVEDSGKPIEVTGEFGELLDTATAQYASYVKDQAAQLIVKTEEFAALYVAGDDDAARALYADARTHWERIEPVAESFGDLDPRLDLREADLADGQVWTGWHRIEKDLWPPAEGYTAVTQDEREELAAMLVADTQELVDRVQTITFNADQLGNGAKELLDEVAIGKVTGEEEIWSHTDLWDFQANVDGARVAFDVLRPALDTKDPELGVLIEERFVEIQALLDQYRSGDGFVLYTELTDAQVKELSDAVNALGEPLSQLTAAVVL
jgi:iron uptake system component EfeO